MSDRRVAGIGLLWLVWIWGLAFASRDLVSWPDKPHGWSWDVERRALPLARWDSGWYVGIVERGYEEPPRRVGQETNHAFFPLYPLLVRAVVKATGLETTAAGCLLSSLAFLLALPLFARFVRRRFGEARVAPALAAFLAFPPAFFFAAFYTEALLVLLALAAAVSVDEDRPLRAALAGFLSGLTRISGVVLAPYLFLATLRRGRERGERTGASLLRASALALAPVAGFSLFCLYFFRRFGDPLLFVRAQHNWAGAEKTIFDGPVLIAKALAQDLAHGGLFRRGMAAGLDGVFTVAFVVVALALLAARRFPEGLYVGAVAGIVFLTGTFDSGGRYMLPAFPAFAAVAGLARLRVFWLLVLLSALLQAVYVFQFVHWGWAG